jgi:hypothetical protein
MVFSVQEDDITFA